MTTWAKAYVSGDPEQLRLAVGDKDPTHAFVPMVGAKFMGATVESATVRLQDLTREGAAPENPSTIVARALLTVSWPGQPTDDTTRMTPFAFDVLIVDANTASPRVVAWSPAGQGGALEPYANAVTVVEVTDGADALNPDEVPSEPTPADAATPTEKPTSN